jgi:predicted ABC-type ATPase
MRSKPLAIFYAGPNGSGKSTLRIVTNLTAYKDRVEIDIDPDAIAREINPSEPRSVDRAAGVEAIRRFRDAIAQHRSFSMETTLTGASAIRRISTAKDAGYEVHLHFIGLDSPRLNVLRVESRVAAGGHHIEEAVIRRRYSESLKNLPAAVALADKVSIYDNSRSKVILFILIEDGQLESNKDIPMPTWIQEIKMALENRSDQT